MAQSTPAQARSFDLKSASLPVLAVVLRSADAALFAADLAGRVAAAPGFFDQDPVLIDLSHVRTAPAPIDFAALTQLLRSHGTLPVAVRGGSAAQMQAARAAGLAAAPESAPARAAAPLPAAEPESEPAAVQRSGARAISPQALRAQAQAQAAPPAASGATMVLDKPLRSGQQLYARGADLVVLAAVSFGAEVIADGHIHVYAPLRGRVIAGARGNTAARIFCTSMEAQLIAIAGIYRTSETPLPDAVRGKPAQVRLAGERLLIEPL